MSVSSPKQLHTRAQTYSQRGMPSSVVSAKDGLAVPALREGEVLVKVTAAALNPVDCKSACVDEHESITILMKPIRKREDYVANTIHSRAAKHNRRQ